MELIKRTLILGIIFLLLMPLIATAFHTPEVSISPNKSMVSQEEEMSLKIINKIGDDINRVSLIIPNDEDGPLFKLKEITSPAGWTYLVRYKVGAAYPYKITWSTEGKGIEKGEFMELGFAVENPSESGNYVWLWETKDSDGLIVSGNLTTSIVSKSLESFEITDEPESIKAGETFIFQVSARNNLGEIKKDYTGTIHFESTDPKALLPENYTFKLEDEGTKKFELEFRTYGNQTFSVIDEESNVSSTSDAIFVKLADYFSISISPANPKIESGEEIGFYTFLTDVYGNKINVTQETEFSVEKEAGGKFTENTYFTENEGFWVVKSKYKGMTAATLLEVVPKIELEINETINETETKETLPEKNETEIEKIQTMKLTYPVSVEAQAGKKIVFNVTVENTGKTNLTGVRLFFKGPISEENIEVLPENSDIETNSFKRYLIVMSVPENITGSLIVPFAANSTQGIGSSGTLFMSVSEEKVEQLSEPDYSEVIVLIIIGLALIVSGYVFLRRKKKEEKPSKRSEE